MEILRYPDEVKTVFGWYGAVAHNAQLFEYELLTLLLVLAGVDELATTKEELKAWESKFSRHTLGQLIKKLMQFEYLAEETEQQWINALDLRNYLVHRFFVENAVKLNDAAMCDKLVEELKQLAMIFSSCMEEARELANKGTKALGLSDEQSETALKEELRRLFLRETE